MVRACGHAVQTGFTLGYPMLVWPAGWFELWEESAARRRALPFGPVFHRASEPCCRSLSVRIGEDGRDPAPARPVNQTFGIAGSLHQWPCVGMPLPQGRAF